MGEIANQLFVEVSPGVWESSYTVEETAPRGDFAVIAVARADTALFQLFPPPRLLIVAPAPPAPPGSPGGAPPAKTGVRSLPEWIDFLSNVIAWAAVFWGIFAVAHAAGFFTVLMVGVLLALTGLLQTALVNPIREAVRYILGTIYQTLLDLLDFVAAWLRAVAQYFQGDLLRAIVRILLVAASLWVFDLAMKIPAFKQLFDWVLETTRKVTDFVNNLADQIQGFIKTARKYVDDRIIDLLGNLGDVGKALRDDILRIVNQVFDRALREVQQLRFEVLNKVDVVQALMTTKIDVLGMRITLLPDFVRKYIRDFYAGRTKDLLADAATVVSGLEPGTVPSPLERTAAWQEITDTVAQVRSGLEGAPAPAAVEIAEAVAGVVGSGALVA